MHSKHWYIVRMTVPEAVDTLHNCLTNGGARAFVVWVKHASKLQLLDAIEYHSGRYGNRHIIINYMRVALTK